MGESGGWHSLFSSLFPSPTGYNRQRRENPLCQPVRFPGRKQGKRSRRSRIAPGDARVFYIEYPYRYTEHLRKSGAFVLVNIRISIPDACGKAGAFVSVNTRINIPNASGGAMAGVVHSGEYPYRYTERPGRLQGIKKSPEPLEAPGIGWGKLSAWRTEARGGRP